MQEPKRLNLLQIVQKALEIADRRNFFHRIIYIFRTENHGPEFWLNALKTMVKNINEGNIETPLVGLGIFYPDYVINVLEGTEDHIKTLLNKLMNLISCASMDFKILLFLPHIDKRYFAIWRGIILTPPIGSQPPDPMTEPSHHGIRVKQCVLQLYQLFELLYKQAEPDSKLCNQYLPATLVLNSLLASPLLLSGQEFLDDYNSAPNYVIYHQQIWPSPPDFVPKHILPVTEESKL